MILILEHLMKLPTEHIPSNNGMVRNNMSLTLASSSILNLAPLIDREAKKKLRRSHIFFNSCLYFWKLVRRDWNRNNVNLLFFFRFQSSIDMWVKVRFRVFGLIENKKWYGLGFRFLISKKGSIRSLVFYLL